MTKFILQNWTTRTTFQNKRRLYSFFWPIPSDTTIRTDTRRNNTLLPPTHSPYSSVVVIRVEYPKMDVHRLIFGRPAIVFLILICLRSSIVSRNISNPSNRATPSGSNLRFHPDPGIVFGEMWGSSRRRRDKKNVRSSPPTQTKEIARVNRPSLN